MSREYTAQDRERWRNEIAEAKRTMTREDFITWLKRKMDVVGTQEVREVTFEAKLSAANEFVDKFLTRIAAGRAAGTSDEKLFMGFLRNATAPERDLQAVGLALTTAMFRLAGPAPKES